MKKLIEVIRVRRAESYRDRVYREVTLAAALNPRGTRRPVYTRDEQ